MSCHEVFHHRKTGERFGAKGGEDAFLHLSSTTGRGPWHGHSEHVGVTAVQLPGVSSAALPFYSVSGLPNAMFQASAINTCCTLGTTQNCFGDGDLTGIGTAGSWRSLNACFSGHRCQNVCTLQLTKYWRLHPHKPQAIKPHFIVSHNLRLTTDEEVHFVLEGSEGV